MRRGKQQIEYTLVTHNIEKMHPSREALNLCEQMVSGTVNADTAVSHIIERYGLVRMRKNG